MLFSSLECHLRVQFSPEENFEIPYYLVKYCIGNTVRGHTTNKRTSRKITLQPDIIRTAFILFPPLPKTAPICSLGTRSSWTWSETSIGRYSKCGLTISEAVRKAVANLTSSSSYINSFYLFTYVSNYFFVL